MIPLVITLTLAALVGFGVLMRRVNRRDDARSDYLDANRVYLAREGRRPVWAVQLTEPSPEQPVPSGIWQQTVAGQEHAVANLNEEATVDA